MILDYSSERIPSSPKVKMRNGKPVLFKPGDVRGIMIHQSACYFDTGTPETNAWLAKRALKVACHLVVYRSGLVAVAAPLDWVMNHGNAPNSFTWAIEVEGHFEGEPGYRRNGRCVMSDGQRTALAEAVEYLVDQAYERGHKLTNFWAHRQSNENREDDPGYDVWTEMVTVSERLGLTADRFKVWGGGQTIPATWDAESR